MHIPRTIGVDTRLNAEGGDERGIDVTAGKGGRVHGGGDGDCSEDGGGELHVAVVRCVEGFGVGQAAYIRFHLSCME